ncbi:extradiol dioxygenase family protein [Natronocella acetinitrilica]|uniref:Extradiol dioxygenase family protein n=1 Tax=Natronocella acetinitrilica TaxID=414046 RepID=A0AAE3G6U9_9GAMM|nr:VOC family protein [Natronocella acetinitrilica]MCP1676860.1 extradiol dioxygenase family protein [Natronocella acetinitrilica]
MSNAFHLAFPVTDLDTTRRFYEQVLGCERGRESEHWVDFNFHGHQITAHLVDQMPQVPTNHVDGKQVPVQHFGLILEWDDWEVLAARLRDQAVTFIIEPTVRFAGKTGEQGTCFLLDPAGNALEFKAFRRPGEVFARGGGHG